MDTKDDLSLKYEERLKLSNYQMIKTLGQGAYGKVFLVEYIPNGQHYALKLLMPHINLQAMLDKEVKALRKVEGVKQCAQLFAVLDPFNGDCRGLSMEYYTGGTLLAYINKKKGFEVEEVRKYLGELVSVLEVLQSLRLAHLDIKTDNILLDQNLHLILCDFGMCEEIPHGPNNNSFFRRRKGTNGFQLPEMLSGCPYCPFQADIFAAAVTVYNMYSCCHPFRISTQYDIMCNNPGTFWKQAQKESPNSDFRVNLNQDFVDLFTKMTHKIKNQRITLNQIKEHPFFTGITDSTTTLS